jgi:hypothetical protein
MNNLTREIITPFLESTGQNIALIPGGFKPPTLGHFYLVNEIAKREEIDGVLVLIGHGVRESITKEQSYKIWELYKKHLPSKVQIKISDKPSPIGDVISLIKNNPQNFYYPVVGYRGEEDNKDLQRFDSLKNKYPNYKPIIFKSNLNISGTKSRKSLQDNNFDIFQTFLPTELLQEDKLEIFNILSSSSKIEEYIEPADEHQVDPKELKMGIKVEMEHTTNPEEAKIIALQHLAEDPKYYTKLATLNLESLNENATYTQHIDYKQKIKDLIKYMLDKGMNIKPLPKVIFYHGNKENAKNFFGKTAYYNPNTMEIVLYTEGRHPKDIVRSFSHEIVHHIQNIENRLGDITTTNTSEDDHLDQIEREAYLDGNITFRNWTDTLQEDKKIKALKYIKEYKQYFLNELFEKDLPNIEKISPLEYIVGNGEDIEAKYYFKFEDWGENYSLNWSFTNNNKNKSPEAWKQVTTTSFRVLEDFLKDNKPKSISISGNTNSKTKLYKAYIDKLQILLNNRYKIDNNDEDKIVLRSIEESKQSSIKKRMETLNESYKKSLNYWENGDIYSKSKIESWNSIKKKIERETLNEFYIKDKKIKKSKDPFGMYQFMRELLEEPIMEGRYDKISNQISSDIFKKWKSDFSQEIKQSIFNGEYQTDDIEVEVEAYLSPTTEIEGLIVDGGVDEENNYMQIRFEINPSKLPEFWEEISMNLKDIIRHEIEHLTHGEGGNLKPSKFIKDDMLIRKLINAKLLSPSQYFKLEKEVDANLQGMYFRAKKEKRPFRNVIDTYLDSQDITPNEKEEILNIWRSRLKALNLPKF